MATKLTFVVREDLTEHEKEDMRYLFSDALIEFRAGRLDENGSAEAYVRAKYPAAHDEAVEDQIQEKIAQVERRCRLAMKLWERGDFTAPVIESIDY